MEEIDKIRRELDEIDKKIITLLEERESLIRELGRVKKAKKLEIIDQTREKKIIAKLKTPYQKEIFKKILEESRKRQE